MLSKLLFGKAEIFVATHIALSLPGFRAGNVLEAGLFRYTGFLLEETDVLRPDEDLMVEITFSAIGTDKKHEDVAIVTFERNGGTFTGKATLAFKSTPGIVHPLPDWRY